MGSSPSIACIGIIGKHDNPLHISIFPPHQHANLELSFMLNSSLDLIDARRRRTAVEQDLGLLHAYDERYATYGWLLNTGTKLLIIVDVGDRPFAETKGLQPLVGLHESDLKSAFQALQTAYVKLLQNPFYTPEDSAPIGKTTVTDSGYSKISNSNFINEVNQIGMEWTPGAVLR